MFAQCIYVCTEPISNATPCSHFPTNVYLISHKYLVFYKGFGLMGDLVCHVVSLCGGTASYIECSYSIVVYILMTHRRYTRVQRAFKTSMFTWEWIGVNIFVPCVAK